MKKLFNHRSHLMVLLLCLFVLQAQGQRNFDKTTRQLAEIKKLKAKVETDPSNLKVHQAFVDAFNPDDPTIEDQYKTWVKRFPNDYAVPFSIGKAFAGRENPKAKPFLLQASILKPDDAVVWGLLAQDATLENRLAKRQEYLQKAMQYAPKNANYAFDYAFSFKDTDPVKYDSLALEVVRRFPESEKSAQALFWLATDATIPQEQVAYYKQLYLLKSNQNPNWYLAGMTAYFDLLLKTNPDAAFELGLTLILDNKRNLNIWKDRIKVADAFLRAKKLLNENDPKQALAVLNKVNLGNLEGGNKIEAKEYLALFKAEAADADNQTHSAFDSLAVLYSKNPTYNLQATLYKYGSKLGMDTIHVAKNILKIRDSTSKQATVFSLQNYSSSGKTTLADYQGKVVLLTYWFPGCGPCRVEFPHFEAVLKKFKTSDIAYLGLNLKPSQDGAVLPFLKESGYTFTALHDAWGRNKGNLPANGAPTNYLIDRKGRIIFSNFRIDTENEKTLELMIKEMLAAKE